MTMTSQRRWPSSRWTLGPCRDGSALGSGSAEGNGVRGAAMGGKDARMAAWYGTPETGAEVRRWPICPFGEEDERLIGRAGPAGGYASSCCCRADARTP